MNTMKRLLMMSALMVVSSSCFAKKELKLVNEGSAAQTVTFEAGYALKDGRLSESVNPGSPETVEVGDNWKGQKVTVIWSGGDSDEIHFENTEADELLISTSADVEGHDVTD